MIENNRLKYCNVDMKLNSSRDELGTVEDMCAVNRLKYNIGFCQINKLNLKLFMVGKGRKKATSLYYVLSMQAIKT